MVPPIDMVAELPHAVECFLTAAPAANQLRFLFSDPLAHAAILVPAAFLVPVQCYWVGGGPLYRELRQRKYVLLGLVRIRREHDWRTSRPEK